MSAMSGSQSERNGQVSAKSGAQSENSKPRSAIGVGIATLVTILVAVLLTTFSVLAFVTARADLRLSNKAVESTQSYYIADGQAEEWLAELDAHVVEGEGGTLWILAGDFAAALADAGYKAATSTDGTSTGGASTDERVVVKESFSIDDRRELVVEVAINKDGGLDILRWQTVSKP